RARRHGHHCGCRDNGGERHELPELHLLLLESDRGDATRAIGGGKGCPWGDVRSGEPPGPAGTRRSSANAEGMSSVLVPPAGVLDGELREPLLRFVQAAFALAQRDLANGAEVPFVLDEHEGRESALYSYRPLY